MRYSISSFLFPFDPHAQLDYQFRWGTYLSRVGDSISNYVVSCDPGLTVVNQTIDGAIVTAWIALDPAAPATIGTRPQVHCDIITASSPTPRKDRRSFELHITAR